MQLKKLKHSSKTALAYIAIITITITPQIVSAQLYNPLGTTSVPQLIGRIINTILGLTGSIALLMTIYGGFLWLTSGGNAGRIEKGQKTLTMAVLGLAIIFGSYALSTFIITQLSGVTS